MSSHEVVNTKDFAEKVNFEPHYLMNRSWEFVFKAIRELSGLDRGESVLIDPNGVPSHLVSKKCYAFARRWGIEITTRTVDGKVWVRRREDGFCPTYKVIRHKLISKVLQLNPMKGDSIREV